VNPILDACLRSWPWDPWLLAGLAAAAVVYVRGWRALDRRDPERWSIGQLACFLGGLGSLFLALASPIEPFSFFLLQVHMLQHLLLMMVAPPLLWLGAPMFPLLRGLPRSIRTTWIAPMLRSPMLRKLFTRLTHPVPALLIYIAATWFWHVPRIYDFAMRSPGWHYVEHLCFLGAALLFWYPVVRPYPARPSWSRWWLVPYLVIADVQNTILSALLTFADRVLYSHYAEVPRLGNVSALDDQATAGVLMWVPGSVAFLFPLVWIGLGLLFPPRPTARSMPRRIALPVVAEGPVDLLRVPLLGRFLRGRHARQYLQAPMLVLAGVIALDGFRGPQVGAMNLAGVVPWIHWRGALILGLLAAGNVFCMACPFTLPRTLARRLRPATLAWPRALSNKWLAVALVVAFLWAYEVFALWDSPWLTAWIILAYFAAAFAVDSLFRGASFCKYVCPIGQFNFVQSTMSPLEVKVRDPAVCATCMTRDCVRGRGAIPGCELKLNVPQKASNFDCTLCLDCIHACPHDNIGILATVPGAELRRSGKSPRYDLAALVLVLVFGAFANAALMMEPILDARDRLAAALGMRSPWLATTLACVLGIGIAALAVTVAAVLGRFWGRLDRSWLQVAARYCLALVPIGFAMWLTHYCFHLLTSYAAIVPVTQRFLADQGWLSFGSPVWSCACCLPTAAWLLRLEIVVLDLGMLGSLYTAFSISRSETTRLPQTLGAFAPWAGLILLLFAAGIWIVFQPMQMRGAMAG
jgi:cytochrome c oxidase assembly factor CtaG